MDTLRRLGDDSARGTERASRVIVPSAAPPAVGYVSALLAELGVSGRELTLRASEGLPRFPGAPSDFPPFVMVVNRLKVLAGLDPIAYPRPVKGAFDTTIRDRRLRIAASFDDGAKDPWCRVSMQEE